MKLSFLLKRLPRSCLKIAMEWIRVLHPPPPKVNVSSLAAAIGGDGSTDSNGSDPDPVIFILALGLLVCTCILFAIAVHFATQTLGMRRRAGAAAVVLVARGGGGDTARPLVPVRAGGWTLVEDPEGNLTGVARRERATCDAV